MVFRSVHGSRVRWAFAHRVAAEEDGWVALYCGPGHEGRLLGHSEDGIDFAEAQGLGVLDPETAKAARAEGERVVAERPWPTGWEDWRPPSAWTAPALPAEWDVV